MMRVRVFANAPKHLAIVNPPTERPFRYFSTPSTKAPRHSGQTAQRGPTPVPSCPFFEDFSALLAALKQLKQKESTLVQHHAEPADVHRGFHYCCVL